MLLKKLLKFLFVASLLLLTFFATSFVAWLHVHDYNSAAFLPIALESQWGTGERVCYPVTYRITRIDPDFNLTPADARQLVEKAADIWHNEAGCQLFKYHERGSITIEFINDPTEISLGLYHPLGHWIKILDSNRERASLHNTIVHELGHALDIDHQPMGIMCAYQNDRCSATEPLSKYDRLALRQTYFPL